MIRVLRTVADVEAVLATVTDPVTRAALLERRASMERLAKGHDPFRGMPEAPADTGWWTE